MNDILAVPQTAVTTSEGRVDLPILYRDASVLQAFFDVDASQAAALMPETGLAPMTFRGRALAALVFFDYRDTSIGPYHEVGLAVACRLAAERRPPSLVGDFLRRSANRRMGFYVVDLPVSTAIACAAGREIWGLPKFVTAMPLTFGARRFSGRVDDPDGGPPICMLAGTYPVGVKLPGIDMVLYSNRAGAILKTVVVTQARMHTTTGRGLRLRVGRSKHPMAAHLRALGLAGARPWGLQTADPMRSRLPTGIPL